MLPVDVAGVFRVKMEVVDGSRNPVSVVDRNTVDPWHLLHIENITGHPVFAAYARAVLPNGPKRLEFVNSPLGPSSWEDKVGIPDRATRTLEWRFIRNGGPPEKKEPLDCVDIQVQVSPFWLPNKLTVNIPFSIYVNVQ